LYGSLQFLSSHCCSLPCYFWCPGVLGLPDVAVVTDVAGVAVASFPAVATVLAVDSVPADPGGVIFYLLFYILYNSMRHNIVDY
jgi:hypothetical protein